MHAVDAVCDPARFRFDAFAQEPGVHLVDKLLQELHEGARLADAATVFLPLIGREQILADVDAVLADMLEQRAEAGELIDQLIQNDPARSEGWALRGAMAMTVYNNLPAAYESYQMALARGGAVAFRLLHDHGPDQTPCGGTLTISAQSVLFDGGGAGHRFQWPLAAIREAAINDFYGSNFGMFHIKAQTPDGSKNFNFAVVRPNDVQLVNRRADADMLLRLMNQRRSTAGQ